MTEFDILNTFFDKIYVVTLERAKERQALFSKNFAGLHYHFFYGQDKNNFSIDALIQSNIYSESLARKQQRYGKAMTPGQIGCSWSHRMIYEDVIKNNYQKVLILEDDSFPLHANIHEIKNILEDLPSDWDLLFFDYFRNEKKEPVKQFWYHIQHALGGLKWNHTMIKNLYPKKMTSHLSVAGYQQYTNAYAISKNAAMVLLNLQTPIQFVADHLLPFAITNELIKGYISHPKIFGQDSTGENKTGISFVDE